jgi:hypothetical protein
MREVHSDLPKSASVGRLVTKIRADDFSTGREAVEMPNDKFDSLGPLYAAIGQELWNQRTPGVDRILLYVEAGDAWHSIYVYEELADVVNNMDDSDALSDAVYEARESEEPSLRWTTMEYEISGGSFKAKFGHDPNVGTGDTDDLREEVLKRYFGDKPVHYDLSKFD